MFRELCLSSVLLASCQTAATEQSAPSFPTTVSNSYHWSVEQIAASTVPALESLAIEVKTESVGARMAVFEGVSMTGAHVHVELEAVTPRLTYLTVRVAGKRYQKLLASEIRREIANKTGERVAQLEK